MASDNIKVINSYEENSIFESAGEQNLDLNFSNLVLSDKKDKNTSVGEQPQFDLTEQITNFQNQINLLSISPEKAWQNYYFEKMLQISGLTEKFGCFWTRITRNPNVSGSFIMKNLNSFPWDFSEIMERTDIPIEQIFAIIPPEKINMATVSNRDDLTINYVEEHPELDWCYYFLSKNKTLTLDFVERHKECDWNWVAIFTNTNIIAYDALMRFPDKINDEYFADHHIFTKTTWGFSLAEAVDLPPSVLQMFLHSYMDRNINIDIIREYPHFAWHWFAISNNPNLSAEFISEYADLIDWDALTANIPRKIIDENPGFPWTDYGFCQRKDLTRAEYLVLLDKLHVVDNIQDYHYSKLLYNHCFCFEDIDKFSENPKIPWYIILDNDFQCEKEIFISKF